MQSNEGSKHFTGRIKESQSFTHNTVKTYKKLLLSFCSSCVFIYWLFFNVSFDLFYFFFSFLLFKSPKLWEHRLYGKCCVYLCVSPSVILSASGMMFTDVSSCFCLSFHVVNPPVLHFHQSVPFLASVWLHLTPLLCRFFISQVKISDFITYANFLCHPVPWHHWHRLSPYCTVCADTTVLYGNKAMQHPSQALPLVDVCLSFLPRKK